MKKYLFIIAYFSIIFSVMQCYSQDISNNEKEKNTKIKLIEHKPKEKTEIPEISVLWVLPFIILLLSIAIIPLVAPNFWHHYYWKYTLFLFAFPMLFICLFFLGSEIQEHMIYEAKAYISFVLLISSLYIISGAIHIQGTFIGTPKFNTSILGIGILLASLMGTTGASMLLIRPLIKANRSRTRISHIFVFFIFTVSNTGGLLTPLGDPPLFVGYLKGIPFTWTLFNLFEEWLLMNICLLVLFFIVESIQYKRENITITKNQSRPTEVDSFKIEGKSQFILLFGIIFCIYFQGFFTKLAKENPNFSWPAFGPQELGMLLMIILSLIIFSPKHINRVKNEFSFFPIKEVSAIFAGIFTSMVPAIYFLKFYGSHLNAVTPHDFFWMTGIFSSFLDNTPTYVVFLELAKSAVSQSIETLLNDYPYVIHAISCGAVFMGSMTYIGNAPNFMVYSIAKQNNIRMPSFFGYILYSTTIMIPFLIGLTIIFFD